MPTYEYVPAAKPFEGKLDLIAGFLISHSDLAPTMGKNIEFGSPEYWKKLSEKYLKGIAPKSPKEPTTFPDKMVAVILEDYFSVDTSKRDEITKNHSLSMAAEGIVGDLLERYLASVLENHNWVWCAGSVVNKIDFIQIIQGTTASYLALQVKNRDNSENSSSSSVRNGTDIKKWFRSFSRTGQTNWGNFPDVSLLSSLSEEKFENFVKTYVAILKTKP